MLVAIAIVAVTGRLETETGTGIVANTLRLVMTES